ncbi:MAG TPA: glycosyltransferase family 39 protein [Polyangia bacterium]|nr:glycosyltransferase family 39 protein [Polyangia bacterium]
MLIALGWCAMRFMGLDQVPYGLTTDETLSGLHVICLAQTGATADGQRWPLFATGFAGGTYTPTYLYTLYLWTRVFGTSIAAIRGLSDATSIATILGVWSLGRRVGDRRTGRLAAAAAALSPWSIHVSRFGVDAPLAVAFLVWGVYLFLRSPRVGWALAAGVVMALAAYTYPPVRLQAVFVTLLLLVLERKRLRLPRMAAFFGALAILCIPLLRKMLDPDFMGRTRTLMIVNPDYIEANRGHLTSWVFVVKQLLDNLYEHLRPSFLFFTGDANLRHSTQIMGELGWLDILALGCLGWAIGLLISRTFRVGRVADQPPSRLWLVAGAAALAAAFGVLPAALCWEGLPHMGRSIGAWPAVALCTGAILSVAWSCSPLVPALAVVLAVAQTVHFVPYYFRVYPKDSFEAWEGPLRRAAEQRDLATFARLAQPYSPLGFRYYLIRNFGDSCLSSIARADQITSGQLPSGP